jgi:hypothetical protein
MPAPRASALGGLAQSGNNLLRKEAYRAQDQFARDVPANIWLDDDSRQAQGVLELSQPFRHSLGCTIRQPAPEQIVIVDR